MIALCWLILQPTGLFRSSIDKTYDGLTSVGPFYLGGVMPALLAYVIALCLLIGGGYGTLNWHAEPAPVKVAGPKSKLSRQVVRPEGITESSVLTTATETIFATGHFLPDGEKESRTSINTPAPDQAERDVTGINGDVPLDAMRRDQQRELVTADVPSGGEVNRAGETAVGAGSQADRASSVTASRKQRTNRRHFSDRPPRRKLAVMTLRTIQFADGRQVVQLIPYRGRERALAFGADE
jgi:hypothetical protein